MVREVEEQAACVHAALPRDALGDLAPVAALTEEPMQERDPRTGHTDLQRMEGAHRAAP